YNPVQRTQLAILCAVFMYNFLLSLKQGSLLTSTVLFMAAILIGKYQRLLRQVTERDRLVWAQPTLDDRQTPPQS
ncbi:MAG: hypothetical protein ACREA4_09215, partial [Nitrososphaera sp.]